MTRVELAKRFEAGVATKAEAAAVTGKPVPRAYSRITGPKIDTATWPGLCVFVYETLTGEILRMPNRLYAPWALEYFGKRAAVAVMEKAPEEIHVPGWEPPDTAHPGYSTPAEPIPAGNGAALPPVADRLARAIIDRVPLHVLMEFDWRIWDVEYCDTVCLHYGVVRKKVPPARWDEALKQARAYVRRRDGLPDPVD